MIDPQLSYTEKGAAAPRDEKSCWCCIYFTETMGAWPNPEAGEGKCSGHGSIRIVNGHGTCGSFFVYSTMLRMLEDELRQKIYKP